MNDKRSAIEKKMGNLNALIIGVFLSPSIGMAIK
jgi:hypothetical protein